MAVNEDVALLRQQMEEHRRQLRQAVGELTDAARAWADFRDVIRERPLVWLAGAFSAGVWLARRR